MGRPLHKKYFGNRNVNTAAAGDDGLGGKQVASVTIDTPGSYTTRATLTFSAPDLAGPGGVTATGTANMEGATVTINAGGTLYAVGDLLTITGAGGAIAYVASVDDPATGVITSVNFTGTGAERGDQTDLTGITTGVATTTDSANGSGATVDVTYRVKSVTISNAGSGYTHATEAAVTFSNGVGGAGDKATGTTVLTSTNEKAIVAYAYVTGGSNKIGDIVKQVSSRRYKVETADGTMVCTLVTDGVADAAGEMTITATDSASNTYYVKKLTAHRATLVQIAGGSNYVYEDNESAPWSFAAASGSVVQIANK